MERILLLTSHESNSRLLGETLGLHYEILYAFGEQDLQQPFDLGILDGPSLRHLESAIQKRRQVEAPCFLPFLLVVGRQDWSLASRVLMKTVDEIILAPVQKIELQARVAALLHARRLALQAQHLAMHDGLTGLLNRHHFFLVGEQEIQRARRYGRPLSAILLDLDHFKRVNDAWGHAAGDQVLQETARRLRSVLRSNDLIGRYGGEEFAILLPETSPADALVLAERLRKTAAEPPVDTSSGPIAVTISQGIAEFNQDTPDLAALLDQADKRLYQAKQNGRNCVVGVSHEQDSASSR